MEGPVKRELLYVDRRKHVTYFKFSRNVGDIKPIYLRSKKCIFRDIAGRRITVASTCSFILQPDESEAMRFKKRLDAWENSVEREKTAWLS